MNAKLTNQEAEQLRNLYEEGSISKKWIIENLILAHGRLRIYCPAQVIGLRIQRLIS